MKHDNDDEPLSFTKTGLTAALVLNRLRNFHVFFEEIVETPERNNGVPADPKLNRGIAPIDCRYNGGKASNEHVEDHRHSAPRQKHIDRAKKDGGHSSADRDEDGACQTPVIIGDKKPAVEAARVTLIAIGRR